LCCNKIVLHSRKHSCKLINLVHSRERLDILFCLFRAVVIGVEANHLRLYSSITSIDIWIVGDVVDPLQIFSHRELAMAYQASILIEDVEKDDVLDYFGKMML
jgi:hypothetical protein